MSVERYERSRQNRPTMSEERWRAEGWKAAPTSHQLTSRTDGLCFDCMYEFANNKTGWRKLIPIMLLIVAAVIFVCFLIAFV